MCGVFAFIAKKDRGPDLETLATIARVTERRGPHAFGFAWIDGRGRMKMFKQAGRISDALGVLGLLHDARCLIGHCRYATQGLAVENVNNHPHASDGGWIVHNGMIHDYDMVLCRHDLRPVSECDSEVLGLLIEQASSEKLIDRCTEAVLSVKKAPLVMLGLWKPGTVVAVRQGNPLHVGKTGHGTYLASLPFGLPGQIREFPNESAQEWGEEVLHATL